MVAPKAVPLGTRPPRWRVRFHELFVDELLHHPDALAILDEARSVLSQDPLRVPGGRAGGLRGHAPLRKYRPHADNSLRLLYVVEGREVYVLTCMARKKQYRPATLKRALARFRAMRHP